MDIELKQANVTERLNLPSPDFFLKLKKWCLIIGGLLTILSTIWASFLPSNVSTIIASVIATLTAASQFFGSLPVDWNQAQVNETVDKTINN